MPESKSNNGRKPKIVPVPPADAPATGGVPIVGEKPEAKQPDAQPAIIPKKLTDEEAAAISHLIALVAPRLVNGQVMAILQDPNPKNKAILYEHVIRPTLADEKSEAHFHIKKVIEPLIVAEVGKAVAPMSENIAKRMAALEARMTALEVTKRPADKKAK